MSAALSVLVFCSLFKNFFREETLNFDIFSNVVSSRRIVLKHIESKKGYRGVQGHALLKNLCTVVAILVGLYTFYIIFRQILFEFYCECFA